MLGVVGCPSRHFAAMQAARARAGVLSVVGNATGSRFTPRARREFRRAGS